jgi:predicted O-methyltransferase YrrM
MATTDRTPGQPATTSRAESLSAHAEGSISEDSVLLAARERAADIGAGAVTPAVGALLSLLTKLSGGKAVVEVGTGAGVSSLWLLSGMSNDGVLTTIDIEPEHQRIAKEAFSDASIGPSRTRLISGRAQEVLTRLADDSYDLVFVDADPLDQPVAGPAIRQPATQRWPRCARRRGSSPRTSCSPRPWCRWATACWPPFATDFTFFTDT